MYIFEPLKVGLALRKDKACCAMKAKEKSTNYQRVRVKCCANLLFDHGRIYKFYQEYVRCWKFKMVLIQLLSIDEILSVHVLDSLDV